MQAECGRSTWLLLLLLLLLVLLHVVEAQFVARCQHESRIDLREFVAVTCW